ncbi:MAG: nucleotide excision repair endonuclease [Verrucomicrobia bacterium]|nr:MAG: nucleotide excision repair endonuclease [Verrucomicrobiota bacterium]
MTAAGPAPAGHPPRQLRLLPWPRPLEERLGREFFLRLPRQPGVYLMWDGDGVLLYVGKAVDLRQRLNSYRFLEGASRKTRRLVHAVRRITYEVHADAEQAVLRENQLLREHRPRFNRLNTWPQANAFVELAAGVDCLEIAVVRPVPEGAARARGDSTRQLPLFDAPASTAPEPLGERLRFGAFPPGVVRAVAALGELLEAVFDPAHAPPLCGRRRPGRSGRCRRFQAAGAGNWFEPLVLFFRGEGDGVVDRLVASLAPAECLFEQRWREERIERLRRFYAAGPGRLRRLRAQFGVEEELVGAALLDDLLARDRERRGRRRRAAAPAGGDPAGGK